MHLGAHTAQVPAHFISKCKVLRNHLWNHKKYWDFFCNSTCFGTKNCAENWHFKEKTPHRIKTIIMITTDTHCFHSSSIHSLSFLLCKGKHPATKIYLDCLIHETSANLPTNIGESSVRRQKTLLSKESCLNTYFPERQDCIWYCWVDSENSTQG